MIKIFRCDKCNETFKSKEEMDTHSKIHQGKIKITIPSFTAKQLPVLLLILVFIVSSLAFVMSFRLDGIQPDQQEVKVGALGSTHEHTDFAIYVDGKAVTPLGPEYYVKSPFAHVESGPGEGYVMHVHATGVTLGMFLKTLGFDFTSDCIEISGTRYCTTQEKRLKFYVKNNGGSWEESFQNGGYVLKNLGKILISYGPETDLSAQQNSVTDFSKLN